jgi:hypothetical protein
VQQPRDKPIPRLLLPLQRRVDEGNGDNHHHKYFTTTTTTTSTHTTSDHHHLHLLTHSSCSRIAAVRTPRHLLRHLGLDINRSAAVEAKYDSQARAYHVSTVIVFAAPTFFSMRDQAADVFTKDNQFVWPDGHDVKMHDLSEFEDGVKCPRRSV